MRKGEYIGAPGWDRHITLDDVRSWFCDSRSVPSKAVLLRLLHIARTACGERLGLSHG